MKNFFIGLFLVFSISLISSISSGPLFAIEAPTGLFATSGDEVVELNWDGVTGAVGYKVYRSEQSGSGYIEIANVTSGRTFFDTGLTNGTTYYYVVTAYNGAESPYSNEVEARPTMTMSKIFYTRLSDFFYYANIWMIDTDGTFGDPCEETEVVLAEGEESFPEGCSAPFLTKDGKYLVYIESQKIKRMDLSGFSVKTLRASDVEDKGLSVSSINNDIVYVHKNASGWLDLHVIDIEGGNDRALMDDNEADTYPDFSPDGLQIIFASERLAKTDVWRINADGTGLVSITDDLRVEKQPRYSPDSTKISFYAWDAASDSYEIYIMNSDGSDLMNLTGGTTEDEFSPCFSPNGTKVAYIFVEVVETTTRPEYHYHIYARNSNGSGSAWHLTKLAYYLYRGAAYWQGKTDGMPPRKINDLNVSMVNSESVTLTFTAPGDDGSSGNASAYDIRYSKSPITEQEWESALRFKYDFPPSSPGSTETIIGRGLLAKTSYYFAVKAVDEQGNTSAISNVILISTIPSGDTEAPAAPSNLNVTANDFLRMELSWDASISTDVAGYKIFRDGIEIAETNETSYVDTVPTTGVGYSYYVKAFDEKQNLSANSNTDSAVSKDDTIPDSPIDLRIHNYESYVELKWSSNTEPDIAGYEIWRKPEGGVLTFLEDAGNVLSYQDTTGAEAQKYIYAIKAYDTAANKSGYSNEAEGIKGWPDNERVLIVVNNTDTDSVEIGNYYKEKRNVPNENVVEVWTSTLAAITYDAYKTQIQTPIKNHIQNYNLHDKILYIVTTKGIPLKIFDRALDSYLADLNGQVNPDWGGNSGEENPYFEENKRFDRSYNTYLVARLSGPTAEYAKGLVDKALYAEKYLSTASGEAWFDLRNQQPSLKSGHYVHAERFIETAYKMVERQGFETTVDKNAAMFPNGTCKNTLFYYGWYSYHNFQPIFDGYFNVGAIAWHLDSASLYDLLDITDNNWSIQMLYRGATSVAGSVTEPYSFAFSRGGIFYERLFKGFNLAEAWWTSIENTHWKMVLVGDPLYNPFRDASLTDDTPPNITNILAVPFASSAKKIKWETSEVAEHKVEYGLDTSYGLSTSYNGWFTCRPDIIISELGRNVSYHFRVRSRDAAGNETISDDNIFMIADVDDDMMDDDWETQYGLDPSSDDSQEDVDDDGTTNYVEFNAGTIPAGAGAENSYFKITFFARDSGTGYTTIEWSTNFGRRYQIYYSDDIFSDAMNWKKAGDQEIGSGFLMTWTDDGTETIPSPGDPSINRRYYKVEVQ